MMLLAIRHFSSTTPICYTVLSRKCRYIWISQMKRWEFLGWGTYCNRLISYLHIFASLSQLSTQLRNQTIPLHRRRKWGGYRYFLTEKQATVSSTNAFINRGRIVKQISERKKKKAFFLTKSGWKNTTESENCNGWTIKYQHQYSSLVITCSKSCLCDSSSIRRSSTSWRAAAVSCSLMDALRRRETHEHTAKEKFSLKKVHIKQNVQNSKPHPASKI